MVELCIPKFTPNHLGDTVFSLKKEGHLTSGVDIHLNKKMRLYRKSLPVVGVKWTYQKLCWKPLNTPSYIITCCHGLNFTITKKSFSKLKETSGKFSQNLCCFPLFLWGRDFIYQKTGDSNRTPVLFPVAFPQRFPTTTPFEQPKARSPCPSWCWTRSPRQESVVPVFESSWGGRMMKKGDNGKGRIFQRWKDDDRIR